MAFMVFAPFSRDPGGRLTSNRVSSPDNHIIPDMHPNKTARRAREPQASRVFRFGSGVRDSSIPEIASIVIASTFSVMMRPAPATPPRRLKNGQHNCPIVLNDRRFVWGLQGGAGRRPKFFDGGAFRNHAKECGPRFATMRAPMKQRSFVTLLAALAASLALLAVSGVRGETDRLRALVDAPTRAAANVARDPYRHPHETLKFLGVGEDSVVVEILPGGSGYWTEILAPYLKDHGRYIAANFDKESASDEAKRGNAAFDAKVAGDPALYGKVETAEFHPGVKDIAPPGSADFVLTFRNVHNWMADGDADAAFAAFFKALKPGGVLGVEEHRGRADQPQDPLAKSGYVRQDYAIALAEKAGFKLAGSSEVNANPKDTKDYSVGVWALPPTYRLKDQDRDKYAAIGESDRFLLKFVKPAAP
jgi:predicted methyltransferase